MACKLLQAILVNMRNFLLLSLLALFGSCTISQKDTAIGIPFERVNSKEFSEWYHNSPTDSTSGIDLERANSLVSDSLQQNEIIVAIIDGVVDIGHLDLKNSIFSNPLEIENNGIDDDNNGYIDDTHGWNFFGDRDGDYVDYGSFSYIQVLKEIKEKYSLKDLDASQIPNKGDRDLFNLVLEEKTGGIEYGQTVMDWAINHRDNYYEAHKLFNYLFLNKNYTIEDLDTIVPSNENDEKVLNTLKYFKKYGVTIDRINQMIEDAYARKYIINNEDYTPYKNIDSFPENPDFINYGNPYIGVNPTKYGHGTQVAGVIGATRNNGLGIKGVSNKIKLMILETIPTYSERPKDFYNAVKYAVDNGAKIINYSSSKYLFADSLLYNRAVEYASNNNVLFVTSAGNSGLNNDLAENLTFPHGYRSDDTRTLNFLMVGASTKNINADLKASFSNYGKNSVDIFAPGNDIKTTDVYENQYINIGGTSLSSALVSGVAALIWSCYPNLEAYQVKEIILLSGETYDIEVNTGEGKKKFTEISRTGAVINAYKALLLAKKYSDKLKTENI